MEGLTTAGKAVKELAESEEIEEGMGLGHLSSSIFSLLSLLHSLLSSFFPLSSLHSRLESLFTG